MKAATGELNLTVITVVAVGLILTFFVTVLWPGIQEQIQGEWGTATDNPNAYIEVVETELA